MAVITKSTVRFKGFTYSLLTILDTLVWQDAHPAVGQPKDIVITSASDGKHALNSKHYTNEALDVRSKSFASRAAKQRFMDAIQADLSPAFTVLYEDAGTPNEHFHIQKRKT